MISQSYENRDGFNDHASLKNTLITVFASVVFAVLVAGPLSNFVISVLGFVFGMTSAVPLTTGLQQTYTLGLCIFGPLLTLLYLCARRSPKVLTVLSAAIYGGFFIAVTWYMQGGRISPYLVGGTVMSALVGYASGLLLAIFARKVSESLPV